MIKRARLPKLQRRNVVHSEVVGALASTTPPAAITAYAAMTAHPLWGLYIMASLWLFSAAGLQVLRAAKRDREAGEVQSPRDLVGPLLVMHSTILSAKALDYDDTNNHEKLRITLHATTRDTLRLEQLVDYVGGTGTA